MKYLLTLYEDETNWAKYSEAEAGKIFGEYFTYTDDMKAKGAFIAGDPLQPSMMNSAMLTTKNGKLHVQDGPFTHSKEQLGGYYLIEAANLDEALKWAEKCPCAKNGTVEVRPIWEIG